MKRNVNEIILDLFAEHETIQSRDVVQVLKLTRQGAHRYLRQLVDEGRLELVGTGRGSYYRRAKKRQQWVYETSNLEEDRVWEEVAPAWGLADRLTSEAFEILHYAVTELVNNVIDHAGADRVRLNLVGGTEQFVVTVADQGVGLFQHVQDCFSLETELHALQELTKGKATTMPSRHSGEGLFFVSKAVDQFQVESGGLRWLVDNLLPDMLVEDLVERRIGTKVTVAISWSCERNLEKIFAAYTENYEFVRTKMVVKLFALGLRFVSRSEAKRLVHGLERFREVILDFDGVRGIGQGFADEVFRVWQGQHPEVALVPINMSRAVAFMVRRAQPGYE